MWAKSKLEGGRCHFVTLYRNYPKVIGWLLEALSSLVCYPSEPKPGSYRGSQ